MNQRGFITITTLVGMLAISYVGKTSTNYLNKMIQKDKSKEIKKEFRKCVKRFEDKQFCKDLHFKSSL